MWVIFIAILLGLVLVALGIWYLANRVYLKIQRDNKQFNMEDEMLEEFRRGMKEIREDFEWEK